MILRNKKLVHVYTEDEDDNDMIVCKKKRKITEPTNTGSDYEAECSSSEESDSSEEDELVEGEEHLLMVKDKLKCNKKYQQMPKDKQKKYMQQLEDLVAVDLPTEMDILDLKLNSKITKYLLNELVYITECCDKLSAEYDKKCAMLIATVNRYKNYSREDIEMMDEVENTLSKNPKLTESLSERILNSKHTDEIKRVMYNKYLHMNEASNEEASKIRQWIETVIGLPTQSKEINLDKSISMNEAIGKVLKSMYEKLNNKVYGMTSVKEEIICIVANMIMNPQSKFKSIGLCGPPGVGKTMIAQIIAEVLELPFYKVSLGGSVDASFIDGHSATYIGAEAGCIVKGISQMGYTNGIILFDEVDKLSVSDKGKEVEASLLSLIDFTQNMNYRDKYMPEVPINLSNMIFIFSMNSVHDMHSALLSRIPVIYFDGFSISDKVEIFKNYLLEEITKNYLMDTSDVVFTDDVIKYIVNNVKEPDEVKKRSGVRNLKTMLDKIIKRINLYRVASVDGALNFDFTFKIPDFKLPYTITKEFVDKVIDKPNSQNEQEWNPMYL